MCGSAQFERVLSPAEHSLVALYMFAIDGRSKLRFQVGHRQLRSRMRMGLRVLVRIPYSITGFHTPSRGVTGETSIVMCCREMELTDFAFSDIDRCTIQNQPIIFYPHSLLFTYLQLPEVDRRDTSCPAATTRASLRRC